MNDQGKSQGEPAFPVMADPAPADPQTDIGDGPVAVPAAEPLPASIVEAAAPPAISPFRGVQGDNPVKRTIAQLKDKIMATAPSNEDIQQFNDSVTTSVTQAMNDAQGKAREAYEKGTVAAGEATEFAKGNVEALVESSRILSEGLQTIGKTYAEEAKSAYEQMTADMKEVATIKSPTELFQLQGKIMRRNFDSLVAASSRNTEAMMKLANEAFEPISGRMSVAADKIGKPV
ncbi:phasin family protein [Croceibacterium mercuriale]|uniref:phasin family protein n=1 Tax=Croceibacterium mercuriale TaxID=1572751 RepID=UPI000AD06C33|nr:phasin family protein [Croceibacterium mercuriale]